jgi:helix-turn-helix protein
LQEAVAGVSGEEFLFAVKETSNKKAIWNKEKRSSKKDKVGIQKSSSESYMEIEVGNNDSGDDISDGDAECLFRIALFSHDKHGEKWAQYVRCYRWAHENCGFVEDYFVCHMCRKGVKL